MNRKISKFLSALLLAAAVAVTQIPVSDVEAQTTASDFQMDGKKLLKYSGTAEVVSIPADVKEIGEEAFAGNDNLVKVTIGEDVEVIGYRAFADCDNLRTVQVGDSVKEIETAAFSNDKALKNVSLGAGVQKLGSGVFAGSSQLATLSLSENNTNLIYQDGVLYDDEKTIVYSLLPNYERLVYTAPSTVEEVKAYAFWGNPYLENVILDSALTNISAYAFSNCMNLKQVEIPLPVHTIEAKAFEDCVNLQSVNIPDSMNKIHDTAFDGCPKVEFDVTPGTYGEEFANAFKASEVDQIEYEDVTESTVIDAEELKIEEKTEETTQDLPVEVQTVTGSYSSETLLGQSSIVAGRAVIFIDNGKANVNSGTVTKSQIDLSENDSSGSDNVGDIISENAQKGKDFPKYTVVNGKIASQAYYQDSDLTEYSIEEGITEIGDFAFARSGLTEIVIPEGVEKIGYGAFYHCDNLTSVTIPNSVKEISANAFAKTPWLESQNASLIYVIVGDGILISYNGRDSVVNIPSSVKQIGAEVFKDHMGVTAVNIPDSVEIIGEDAFSGCKNLKTVNGGDNLIRIEAGAFQGCPLSQVTISSSVQEIGVGAFDFTGGTDTVVFHGNVLPSLVMGENTGRLSSADARTYALGGVNKAIVPTGTSLEGTVLAEGCYGFKGIVYDEAGNQIADLSNGVEEVSTNGVMVQIFSKVISDEKGNVTATLPGNEENFVLRIKDSEEAVTQITAGYSELYGGKEPSNLVGFDISLYDSTGQISISKLGKQYITVLMPLPDNYSTEGLHMVTLDSDGQLEAVEYLIVNLEDGDYIQFTTNHFSPYGLYRYSNFGGQGVVSDGKAFINLSGKKDDTPDTGDISIHPKWILAVGLFAAAVALFFYKGKKVN